jgi:hypothetical protein
MRGVQTRRGVRLDLRKRPPVVAVGSPTTNGGLAVTGNGQEAATDIVAPKVDPESVKRE